MSRARIKLLLVILILCLTVGITVVFSGAPVDVGTITGKRITGIRDGNRDNLFVLNQNEPVFLDSLLADLMVGESGDYRADEELEGCLSEHYTDIRYHVRIGLCRSTGTRDHELLRADFNTLSPGMIVKFRLDGRKRNLILELLEY